MNKIHDICELMLVGGLQAVTLQLQKSTHLVRNVGEDDRIAMH